MIKPFNRQEARKRRQLRVRKKVSGTSLRPRMCVSKTNKNIFVQLIDDVNQVTLVSASTMEKGIKNKAANVEAGKEIGTLVAKRALENKIEEVVFDRSGYLYHGVVKAVAEAAREVGLKF